jgi:hypothetical protein
MMHRQLHAYMLCTNSSRHVCVLCVCSMLSSCVHADRHCDSVNHGLKPKRHLPYTCLSC